MALTTTLRNYISIAELQTLANITVTNNTEALRQLDRAEQAVDNYVGVQEKVIQVDFRGIMSSLASSNLEFIDTNPPSQLHVIDDYFKDAIIEIIGGTGIGQKRFITSSSYDNRSVTIIDNWDTLPDTTSFYRIYQLAKFPRIQDMYSRQDGRHFYKAIPDAIKQAVSAQIEFQIAKGNSFFSNDDMLIGAERIGNYSYSRSASMTAKVMQLCPRARTLLEPFKNSGGYMMADNTTNL